MSLQQALQDCLIDFDRRVLVTELLEKYQLTYKEVHETLEAYIEQEERNAGTKYEKRHLVHGTKAAANGGAPTELYTIVRGESKLKEWKRQLENAQSMLYSVELAGGSKAAAPIFKPMQHLQVKLAKVEKRATAIVSNGVHKPPTEPKTEPVAAVNGHGKVEAMPANKKKDSPMEQHKSKAAGGSNKKGSISNFFTAGAAAAKTAPPPAQVKESKAAPSSMDNFFKKQAAPKATASKSPTPSSAAAPSASAVNTSVQLFEESSSDEEEKVDRQRRKIIASDNESDADDGKKPNSKRRRIIDSDDEQQQPQKKAAEPQQQDVIDVDASTSETYLDEEGFVITIKPKKQTASTKKRTSPTATAAASAPPAKKKTPPTTGKRSGTGATPASAKTKQGNIMSFFTKK